MSEPLPKPGRKNEQLFRCCLKHDADTEQSRLSSLSSALEAAGHALFTVCSLLDDDDFGDTFWEDLEAVAAPLLKKAETIRQRNDTRNREMIDGIKAEMAWRPGEEQAGAEGA